MHGGNEPRLVDQQFALPDSPVFKREKNRPDEYRSGCLVIVAAEQADAGRCTSILVIGLTAAILLRRRISTRS
jgi:hypothetical protein